MIIITVEQLDIVIEANVTQALKEMKKLTPTIKSIANQIKKTKFDDLSKNAKKAINETKQTFENAKNVNLKAKINNDEFKKELKKTSKALFDEKKVWEETFKALGGKSIKGYGSGLNLSASSSNLEKAKNLMHPVSNKQKWENDISKYPKSNIPSIDYETAVKQMKYAKELQNQNVTQSISMWEALKQKIAQVGEILQKNNQKTKDMSSKVKEVNSHSTKFKANFNGINQIAGTITNKIKNIGGDFKIGLANVLKYAGALFSIRSIYSILRQSASNWLSSQNAEAQQATANIDYMKNALGSSLAPVINYVIGLVYQLMKAVQSVVYALTGMNIFAKASAQSFANTAGSAKKASEASKTLAGVHSEINNVGGKESSGGGGGSGSAMPSFDLSQIDNTPNRLIDALKSGNWYEIGKTIGLKLNEAMDKIPWEKIKQKAGQAGKKLGDFINGGIENTNWNKVGGTLAEGINTIFTFLYNFLSTIDFKEIRKGNI